MWPELPQNMAAGCQVMCLAVMGHHFQCIVFIEAGTEACSVSRGKGNRLQLQVWAWQVSGRADGTQNTALASFGT